VRNGALLSVSDCRHLLGTAGAGLADTDVVRLRDQLYAIAEIALLQHERSVAEREAALRLLPADVRDGVEERAAVLEFDAGMTRSTATRTALEAHLRAARRTSDPNRP
jgi:hypothetical protein